MRLATNILLLRETLVQLYRLVDILAIQLSLVTTSQEMEETANPLLVDSVNGVENTINLKEATTAFDKSIQSSVNTTHNVDTPGDGVAKLKVESNSVKMLKIDDKNCIPSCSPVAEETVGVGEEGVSDGSSLPLCCWHCSLPFPSFPSLSSHQCCSNTSSPLYRRHHRCPQCGAILSSMWRLRQHLATHQSTGGVTSVTGGSSDHPYGRSSRRVQPPSVKVGPGDHGYATASASHSTSEGTPPGSAVHSEHSYGTKARVQYKQNRQ